MAKGNQIADGTGRRRKGPKMEDKGHSQSNKGKNKNNKKSNSSNGTDNDKIKKDEAEDLVVPDSSAGSENEDRDEEDEVVQVEDTDEDDNGDDEEEEEEEEEEEAKSSDVTNQRSNKAKNGDGKEKEDVTKKNKNNNKNKNTNKNAKSKENESAASHCFPMNRISRIIKSENPDIRITQEAVFLINRASEKFLELFCKEAYACAFLDRKNQVWYQHLASVVSKRKRFDFLSDFVPEKVKAEDALAEMPIAET